jgi:thioredoxin reductase/Pyruvate/2-oxoacid:ferredoxin oxidoreductase delta subunit
MEPQIESLLVYGLTGILCLAVIFIYLRILRKKSRTVEEKIEKAKLEGFYEPVSLHPVVDPNTCIGSGACIVACPEKDILGIRNGKATTINASHCIGHGACFHACPTQAITLVIGTEKRGVDLPHVNQYFETNVPGIFIAGELGGMGLIKNAVVQGQQVVNNIVKQSKKDHKATYDLIIIGAGPAGIAASLNAKKHQLKFLTLEQDTLGGTVFSFPRSKVVMTSTMDLPLYGKVKLSETSKTELLDLWKQLIRKYDIPIKENCKVEGIFEENGYYRVETLKGEKFTSKHILLSIGRRGSPRKLGVPGESLEKVAYRLLEPEDIKDKNILVVGGGDSAIESALMLAGHNYVMLAYRGEAFSRIKPKNSEKLNEAVAAGQVDVRLNTNVIEIEKDIVIIKTGQDNEHQKIKNDLVYIFAGGEPPTEFLEKVGLKISKKFGEAVMKH